MLFSFPGGLCSDLAEIDGASENMLISVEHRHDGEVEIKIPFAGATFTVYLLFYLKEPWVSPEILFSDRHFMSLLSADDLKEHVRERSFLSSFSQRKKNLLYDIQAVSVWSL